jgi:hypothetical protein
MKVIEQHQQPEPPAVKPANTPPRPAVAPEGDAGWTGHDPHGVGRPGRVEVAAGQVTVTVSFRRFCSNPVRTYDRSLRLHEAALRSARRHPAVRRWREALAEQEVHARAAQLARAEADAAAARRAKLVAEGMGPDLAARLKGLSDEQGRLAAEAEAAEGLARAAGEAVTARRREAEQAVSATISDATSAEIAASRRREQEVWAELCEKAGPLLDELAANDLSRQGLALADRGGRGVAARQLLEQLAAAADVQEAARE